MVPTPELVNNRSFGIRLSNERVHRNCAAAYFFSSFGSKWMVLAGRTWMLRVQSW